MAKYEVRIPETRTWSVVVDANDEEEAAEMALEQIKAGDVQPMPALPFVYGQAEVSEYVENIDDEEIDHGELPE